MEERIHRIDQPLNPNTRKTVKMVHDRPIAKVIPSCNCTEFRIDEKDQSILYVVLKTTRYMPGTRPDRAVSLIIEDKEQKGTVINIRYTLKKQQAKSSKRNRFL